MNSLAGAVALALFMATASAAAFRTGADLSEFRNTERVAWATPLLSYKVAGSLPPGVQETDALAAVQEAVGVWNGVACSAFRFDNEGLTSGAAQRDDGLNSIEWVRTGWADLGLAPDDAAGVTDITYAKADGGQWRIVEADIYLNAEHHAWVARPPVPPGYRDIVSVVAHEAGHALGLLHSCELDGKAGAALCDDVVGEEAETMYPVYGSSQATLADDDKAGACFLYPVDCEGSDCASGPDCVGVDCSACEPTCSEGETCMGNICLSLPPTCDDGGCETACETDSDCERGSRCDSQKCVGTIPLGDPCQGPTASCETGVCSGQGYCALPCDPRSACEVDGACDMESTPGVCVESVREPLGAKCDAPSDCLGNECVSGFSETPVCTRACGDEQPDCVTHWECAAVDGKNVCIPAVNTLAPVGGGCDCAAVDASNASQGITPLALALLLLTRRRRKRHDGRIFRPHDLRTLRGTR